MSGDPEQEYFADGMVEEIITALSRIRWLFVAARNSRFTYKGQTVDVKQSARIGSAKRRGNRAERGGHHQAAWCRDPAGAGRGALQSDFPMRSGAGQSDCLRTRVV